MNRLAFGLIAPALAVSFASAAGAQTLTVVNVAMRDGTLLATDVWQPSTPSGPRPVLLRRTPYGRRQLPSDVAGLINLGYVVVEQDVRGRGDSAGTFVPFFNDADDGYDTIEWAAAQPWANGNVGTYGASAEGIVQLMALGAGPPSLRCAFVMVATDDMYEGLYPGGAWRTELTTAWLTVLGESALIPYLRSREAGDAQWDPVRLDSTERARVAVPVFLQGGYFDIFAVGVPRTFAAFQAEVAPAARPDQFLLFGPWTHGGFGTTLQGEVTFPADAAWQGFVFDVVAYASWCLEGGTRPNWASVRYYVMQFGEDGATATGQWRTATAWPPPATPTTLYLHEDGLLRAASPVAAGASASVAVDPANPVPSVGGGNLTTPAGPFDQSAVDARADVLTVRTPPMTQPVELGGDVRARIWAASATTDVDVVVRLEDVTTAGHAMLLAGGVRRGRFVTGFDAIRALTPGVPAAFDIDVGPVGVTLPAGHVVRVAIAGTSNPHFEPNPNVADPLASNPTPVATTLTIYRDAAHPSAITVPLASGTIPESAPPGGTSAPPTSRGGCGCRAAAGSRPAPLLAFVLLVALVSVGRRLR